MNTFEAEVAKIDSQEDFYILYLNVKKDLLKLLKLDLPKWIGIGDKVKCSFPEASISICKGDDDDRFNMYLNWWFTGGQACYQGPKRRTVVHLKCGPEDVLEHVVEPETCMYEMIMRTPVACNPKDLDPEYDMVEEACWNRETSRCDTSRFSN